MQLVRDDFSVSWHFFHDSNCLMISNNSGASDVYILIAFMNSRQQEWSLVMKI